ncbi:MAG TPA: hypothetical protein VFO85_07110, partial [Vicinamibacteria bacterium]|nr:hypothetical protein [Vicinamibacteria bacterium]
MGDDPGRLQPLAAFELRARAAGEAARALFVNGDGEPTAIHPSDVVQGQHYDCFLMGAMAVIAQQHPDPDRWMRDLIEVNPDGSYTVTLHEWIMSNPITGEPAGFRLVTEVVRDTLPLSASSDDDEKWV